MKVQFSAVSVRKNSHWGSVRQFCTTRQEEVVDVVRYSCEGRGTTIVDVVRHSCEGRGTMRGSGTEANSKGERGCSDIRWSGP